VAALTRCKIGHNVVDIEVACYQYEGIDAIKAALKKGLSVSTEEMPVRVSHLLLYPAVCLGHAKLS